MLRRFVRSGDFIRRVGTARQWNEFINAADAHNFNRRAGVFDSVPVAEAATTYALIDDISGNENERGDIRSIETPAILPSESDGDFEQRMILSGDDPVLGKFGVLLEAGNDQLAKIAMTGVVAVELFVPTDGDWIDRADVDTTDSTRLKADPAGSAQILWQESGTNTTVNAIVRLGTPTYLQYPGKADGAITAGTSTGEVTVFDNGVTTNYNIENVHLDWMHMSQDITTGKEVMVGWFPQESLWRVVAAECE